ncbi:MAG: S26 family signal peptidase [Ilumatobacter coccineus]|uniref:S26 family signal peptidase n=1 Tax=Ilumatobacter coccineus TaxID=467094 RepID=A0A2G6K7T3_9ACTN|nr:MAG: S26 family signal peptidase [Ilumatobacter coccineus]
MRRFRRFVVAENSMLPALTPGDGLIAMRSSRLRRGQLRCFEHPERPGFWLVKRVGDIHGQGTATVFCALSDRPGVDVVDSRRFGPVSALGTYRVIARIPARLLGN